MKKTAEYRAPSVELIRFDTDDVLAESSTGGGSSGKDENAGEWDPQPKQKTQKMNLF